MTNLLLTSIPYFKEGEGLLFPSVGRTYDPVQSYCLLSVVIIVVSFLLDHLLVSTDEATGNRNNEIQSAGQIQGAFCALPTSITADVSICNAQRKVQSTQSKSLQPKI